nr:MGMT family protein [Tamilnaduibacter salinus]
MWHIVCAIPPGRVDSYGRVAARAGFPGRMAPDSDIP